MSEFFYDAQVKRYLTQFMRLMSNFSIKDAKGILKRVPVRYGDMNRQVAQILNKNSENVIQSAPFIACYIKGLDFDRERMQDPTFVSKVNIRERAYDDFGNEYLNTQGANYTVERIMPTPFKLKMTADIWCSNVDQKLQLFEQIAVLFNPAFEIQTSNNFIDWTSLSLVMLNDMQFSSRAIPQGMEQDIDVMTMNFETPIWVTPPAKVKQLGIITKIITNVFAEPTGTSEALRDFTDGEIFEPFTGHTPVIVKATTLGNFSLLVMNNTAKLVAPNNSKSAGKLQDPPSKSGPDVNWRSILDRYPGVFTAGVSQLRLAKPDGNELVGYISLSPLDDFTMYINWDLDTVPMNTLIADPSNTYVRGTVDAIVNPQTFNPRPELPNHQLGWPITDTRYLLLEDTVAWFNQDGTKFDGRANDIVQWSGSAWQTIFNHQTTTEQTFITNSRTGIQYVWDGTAWLKSYDGIYDPLNWRLVL